MTIPECWKVIEFTKDGETIRKVFGGWRGGYLHGDSWRLNSGIVKTEDIGDAYIFHGSSGSQYKCYKNLEGINGVYLHSIFNGFVFNSGVEAKVIDYGDSDEK